MSTYPIVILPGWLLGSDRFKATAEEFHKAGYPTFIVDFPGFEQGIKLTQAFNLTDYVKHLQKFLRTHKITKAVFVCHSFGGRVALKLISQEPKLAAALILSGTPGLPGMTKLRFNLTVGLAKIGKLLSFVPPFLFLRPQLQKIFYRVTRANDYYRANGILKSTFKNIIKEQLIEYMKKIRVPTLLLWGEKDKLVPLGIARQMQKLLVNSKLEIVPGKGHMFIYREPEVSVKCVIDYLKTL